MHICAKWSCFDLVCPLSFIIVRLDIIGPDTWIYFLVLLDDL